VDGDTALEQVIGHVRLDTGVLPEMGMGQLRQQVNVDPFLGGLV
jgi:hypothetical protein